MNYEVFIGRRRQKELEKIPRPFYDKIKEAILNLEINPRPAGVKKLTDRSAWRIRIGNYRVVYEIDDQSKIIIVIEIGHRKEVYR